MFLRLLTILCIYLYSVSSFRPKGTSTLIINNSNSLRRKAVCDTPHETSPPLPPSTTSNYIIQQFVSIDPSVHSFFSAALLSNIFNYNGIPSYIEKYAWSTILQSALVLGIWAGAKDDSVRNSNRPSFYETMKIAYIFFVGVLGSTVGGWIALHSSMIFFRPHTPSAFSSLCDCKAITSCLVSSYIGGTVNFYDTALYLKVSTSTMKLLNSVAAIDILVMVIYFTALMILKKSRFVTNFIGSSSCGSTDCSDSSNDNLAAKSMVGNTKTSEKGTSLLETGRLYTKYLISAVSVAYSASLVQARVAVPGISVAISTVVALLLCKKCKQTVLKEKFAIESMSTLMLCLFYAIIGLSCKLADISQSLQIFYIVITTLIVHLVSLLSGSMMWNRTMVRDNSRNKNHLIDIDTIIVTSNALIGGPATSSSMAAVNLKRTDLVLVGSTLGIIGYVIGTYIGVALFYAIK